MLKKNIVFTFLLSHVAYMKFPENSAANKFFLVIRQFIYMFSRELISVYSTYFPRIKR